DGRVPAGVAAGIFVIGGEDRAASLVELVDIAGNRLRIGCRPPLAADGDPAARLVGLRTVVANDRHHVPFSRVFHPGTGGEQQKAASVLGRLVVVLSMDMTGQGRVSVPTTSYRCSSS